MPTEWGSEPKLSERARELVEAEVADRRRRRELLEETPEEYSQRRAIERAESVEQELRDESGGSFTAGILRRQF